MTCLESEATHDKEGPKKKRKPDRVEIVMADTEAVPLKQRRRSCKKTGEMAADEKADKDFPVEVAVDDRE